MDLGGLPLSDLLAGASRVGSELDYFSVEPGPVAGNSHARYRQRSRLDSLRFAVGADIADKSSRDHSAAFLFGMADLGVCRENARLPPWAKPFGRICDLRSGSGFLRYALDDPKL